MLYEYSAIPHFCVGSVITYKFYFKLRETASFYLSLGITIRAVDFNVKICHRQMFCQRL